ncbi:MAG: glycosyltransferase family 4 protein [Candidatus Komeilibacteria bacterium]
MKILLFTTEYRPQHGGVANYYYGLVTALKKAGFAIEILHISNNIRWWQAWLLLWRHRADIIWVGNILPLGTAAYLYSRVTGKPYFVSLHGLDINLAVHNKPNITQRILKRAFFITVNSNYTAGQVPVSIAVDKIIVLYPCPHNRPDKISDQEKIAFRQQYNLQGKQVLVSVGRLVKRKGIQNVILSLSELVGEFPNLVYLIIGDGEYYDSLVDLAKKLNLADKINFLPAADDKLVATALASANIFLLPALLNKKDVEGFGIVYLEAGLAALPVIASPSGGVAEAVLDKQTGYLLKKDNLTEVIRQLLTDPAKSQAMGHNGRRRAQREFTYQQQIIKLIPWLEKIKKK